MLYRLIFCMGCIGLPGLLAAQLLSADSLRQLLPRLRPDTVRVQVLTELCQRFTFTDAPTALAYGLEARKLAERLRSRRQLAEIANSLGNIYNLQGNYPEALQQYLSGLAMAERLQYPLLTATLYNNLGNVYRFEGGPDDALPYYRKALQMREKIGDRKGIATSLNNIAVMYDLKGRYDSSLYFYRRSLHIKEELRDSRAIANTLHNIGVAFYRRKQYDSCLVYQEKALLLAGQDKSLAANIRLVRASVYADRNQPEQALQEAQSGLAIARELASLTQITEFQYRLASLYARSGDYVRAYEALSAYQTRKDSLQNDNHIRNIERLKLSYLLQKKDLENQALTQDKRLRIAENMLLSREKELQRQALLLAEVSLRQQESDAFMERVRYQRNLERKNRENEQLLRDRQMRQTELKLQRVTIERQYAGQAVFGILLLSLALFAAVLYRNNRRRQAANLQLSRQKEEILMQNEAIHAQNLRLNELNTLKDKLFSIISHDFRSPLHALQGILTLLRMEALTPEETRFVINELSDKLGVTLHMLENMLHWAKNQMEGIQIKSQAFDLSLLAKENIALIRSQADKKQVGLYNRLEMPVWVWADPDMLNIVIRNLLTNAIKFTPPGGLVTLSAEERDHFIYFAVTDTGTGIMEENRQKLFADTVMFSTPGTASEKGTGLGLLLCQDFVERNGGTLSVESVWGKGSTFTFSVPGSEWHGDTS
jgi:signal transduction histidine kinase